MTETIPIVKSGNFWENTGEISKQMTIWNWNESMTRMKKQSVEKKEKRK
jgi:hypothetical protein